MTSAISLSQWPWRTSEQQPHLPRVVLLTTGGNNACWASFWTWIFVLILVLTCTLYERKRDQSFLVFLFLFLFLFFLVFGSWHLTSKGSFAAKNFSKPRRRQAAHGSIDITSSLDICEGGLIPRRHKEGHIRQLSNWDAWGVSRLGQEKGW